MLDEIHICNLEVFANHGVYPEENVLGQKFVLDVFLYLDTSKAGQSDALDDSTNYGQVAAYLEQEMKSQNDKLLERIAERLARGVLKTYPLVRTVSMEVKKPWAPVMRHIDYASVKIQRGWHTAFIGVGSNMGDRQGYLDLARKELEEDENMRSFYAADVIETEPYGYKNQDRFLNTVYQVETTLSPMELLLRLQEIEQEANRVRKIHWGPRTLDLDILLYDDQILCQKELVIPHPEIQKRMFVLEPLCQLNPYGVHPLFRKRFCDLKEELSEKEGLQE
ncbi:MAG: 2-amino-4-hydroxy-6-hydroxymethyldihydropteridine diphosphokinase [Lachnospiraceae bacterium]|nr:2-amino-4-hydroxy-6-hydroxymethyldihydropteridine diphosphokinase [Lachnospiraceae bacterium]